MGSTVFPPAGGGGKVLQVVFGSTATSAANSTTTYADSNLTATITPTLATSQVLVLVNQNSVYKTVTNSGSGAKLKILRGATDLIAFEDALLFTGTALELFGAASSAYLDSPSTTSATTYKTQFANRVAASQIIVQQNSVTSTIVLLEIGA